VFHIHLVSDATGETLNAIAKAATAQFEGVDVRDHFYALVRSPRQLERVMEHIREDPGLVFFTVVNPELRRELESQCRQLGLPCHGILDAPIAALRHFLGNVTETHKPGGQHEVDQRYLHRIEALNFAIAHDDGQSLDLLNEAEVILVGASRTSKTPTCVYLAIRGGAANVPLVPNIPPPVSLFDIQSPLVVGLWASPDRLVQIRRNRLTVLGEVRDTSYVDLETVRSEVAATRKLFEQHGWPAIDVSRRSVEETAAAVVNLLTERREAANER
jgi:regulator of PEP synthase PpsR (kinase-PPPase family)